MPKVGADAIALVVNVKVCHTTVSYTHLYQYFARLFPQAFYRNDEGWLAGIEQNDEESSGGSTRFPG